MTQQEVGSEPRAKARLFVWLLFGAFCLHNLEEALTYARYRPLSADLLGGLLGHSMDLPSPPVFIAALAAITALAASLALWVSQRPFSHAKRLAIRGFAIVLLINVILPHVPAAVLLGGYAPGVVTAVLLNLPLSILVLRRLHQAE